jgi:hypothetical protein
MLAARRIFLLKYFPAWKYSCIASGHREVGLWRTGNREEGPLLCLVQMFS